MEQSPKHLEPSTADMADQEPTAAAKVFVIPELVENILEKLAEDDYIDDLQPLTCISAVQRVSTLFHDTITNSKKIQRLMVATPLVDCKWGAPYLLDGAIYVNMCDSANDQQEGRDSLIQLTRMSNEDRQMLRSDEFREGSWRRVRLQGKSTGKIWVDEFSDEGFADDVEFEVDGDATLGDLVDSYFEELESHPSRKLD